MFADVGLHRLREEIAYWQPFVDAMPDVGAGNLQSRGGQLFDAPHVIGRQDLREAGEVVPGACGGEEAAGADDLLMLVPGLQLQHGVSPGDEEKVVRPDLLPEMLDGEQRVA